VNPNPHAFTLSLSGLPGGAYSFATNPLTVTGGAPSSTTLTIDTGVVYCPGSYAFTVSASNTTDDTGSASATLTVLPTGPTIQAVVSTDKSSYRIGDKITILYSVNRAAQGYLTISPPSGVPQTYPFQSVNLGGFTSKKTLTAAQPIGRWAVSLQANDYCGVTSTAVTYFDVSPDTYDASISLNGVPSQVSVNIQVDGTNQGTMSGSEIKKLTFKIDTTHTISVDQYVSGDMGVRYYCAKNSWTVSSTGSYAFDYETQYLFTVATDPDGITSVTGGGWFKAGTTVQTNQVSTTVPGSAGTQYAFKGWEVDGVAQSGNGISLTMDKPHKAVAKYETQYQLLIDSPYGAPKGQGFYAAGSTATFSVTSPWGYLVQHVFVRWEGDYTGTSPQGSITMDKPKVIHAVWTTSYIQLIAVIVVAGAAIGVFLFWRRRRGPAPETKPTPPAPGETGEAAASVKCSSCGAENSPDQKFCTNCGEKLTHRRKRHT